MNSGILSIRYAKALLTFTQEQGDGEIVCRQAELIEKAYKHSPKLSEVISDDVAIDKRKKMQLIQAAIGEEMSPTLNKFLQLVVRNGRVRNLRFMLHAFVKMYYDSLNVRFATMTTAVPPTKELEEKLCAVTENLMYCDVVLEKKIDPSIVGGFIFTIEDLRLDASISGQFKKLRKEFISKNKRIV